MVGRQVGREVGNLIYISTQRKTILNKVLKFSSKCTLNAYKTQLYGIILKFLLEIKNNEIVPVRFFIAFIAKTATRTKQITFSMHRLDPKFFRARLEEKSFFKDGKKI